MITAKKEKVEFNLSAYLQLARPEHWVKHVFILPGVCLAFLLSTTHEEQILKNIVLGFLSACLLASANYVINGWLDGQYDKYHPNKKDRPAATGKVLLEFVMIEYVALIVLGLFLANLVNKPYLITSAIFAFMGIVYNVRPLRFKDYAFLDVITESVNNPLRLFMGWCMISANTIPPLSLIISYWFGGAFLMGTKRLAEYKYIAAQGKLNDLFLYRRSFKGYTESSLILSSFLYGLISSFFVAAFLIKHKNEFLFLFPFLALLFTYYLKMALDVKSVVQNPEKLHKDKGLVLIVAVIVALFFVLTFTHIPFAGKVIGIGAGLNYFPFK
jgi:decaprenyl-phosphate phosphoribosyltransferase